MIIGRQGSRCSSTKMISFFFSRPRVKMGGGNCVGGKIEEIGFCGLLRDELELEKRNF